MRLFVAVNLSIETRARLVVLCDELREASVRGKFTLPENLHLTLAFLGECDEIQTASVKAVIGSVSFDPFDLIIDCIGRFKRNSGDIWWVGVRENEVLLELHQKLTAGLNASGFVCEERKYSPHITLGREIVTKAQPRQIEPFGETVLQIDLMKSERIAGKLAYTSIYAKRG